MNTVTIKHKTSFIAATVLLSASLLAGCAVPVTRTVWTYDRPDDAAVVAPLARYGTIGRIEVVETQVGVSGGGAAAGALIGGVVGSGLSRHGMSPFAVVGAVAGALIGNNVEEQQARAASGRHYQVTINFDDGRSQTYKVDELRGLYSGERVKLERGVIVREE